MNSVLEYAKLYASLGWKVFPDEKRILNGKDIVVVFKPEGVKDAREKYPNTPIYSIREI